MKSLRNQTLFLALVVAVAAIVAGCGGGGSSSGNAATGGSGATGGSSDATEFTSASTGSEGSGSQSGKAQAASQGQVQGKDPVSTGPAAVSIERRDIPLTADNDEIQSTGAKAIEPCKLVTRSEASSILGKGTKAVERPQGPTCVYTNAGRTITLVVEDNSVAQLRKSARKATKVDLGSKTGWCIKYQSTSVIVGISEGRVLRADGPCQAGVRFVSKALRRI